MSKKTGQLRIKPKMVKRARRWCYTLTADYVHSRGSVLPCFKGQTQNSARDTWRTLHDFIMGSQWRWQVTVWAKYDYGDEEQLRQEEHVFENRRLPDLDEEVEKKLAAIKQAGNSKFLADWGWRAMILPDKSARRPATMQEKLIRKLEKELRAS